MDHISITLFLSGILIVVVISGIVSRERHRREKQYLQERIEYLREKIAELEDTIGPTRQALAEVTKERDGLYEELKQFKESCEDDGK